MSVKFTVFVLLSVMFWRELNSLQLAEVSASYAVFAEQLMGDIKNKSDAFNLEPLTLPTVSGNFSSTLFFPFNRLYLTNGTLQNWLSMKWSEESKLYFGNGALFIAIQATFPELQLEYELELREMSSGNQPHGKVRGSLILPVLATVELDDKLLFVRSSSIDFPEKREINYSIEGAHVPGFYKEFIFRLIPCFSKEIFENVENSVSRTFQDFVNDHFPRQPSLSEDP